MFTLLRILPVRRILIEQMPAIASAWLVAELFYKFQSFSLECAAFLATWFVFDAVIQGLQLAVLSLRRPPAHPPRT